MTKVRSFNCLVCLAMLLAAVSAICTRDSMDLYGLCISCSSVWSGCQACEDNECTACAPGYYLFKNTTISYGVEVAFTSCVAECSMAHHAYVNDPLSGKCQYCGEACYTCSRNYGCIEC